MHVHANVLQSKTPLISFSSAGKPSSGSHVATTSSHVHPFLSLPSPKSPAFNDSLSCVPQHRLFFRVGEDCAEEAEKRERLLKAVKVRHHSLPGKLAVAFGPARQPLLGIQACAQRNAPQKRPQKQHRPLLTPPSFFGAAPLVMLSVLSTPQCLLGPFENFPILSSVP